MIAAADELRAAHLSPAAIEVGSMAPAVRCDLLARGGRLDRNMRIPEPGQALRRWHDKTQHEMEWYMTRKSHNAKAGKDQFGSSGDNQRRQEQQQQDPQSSNARDRENRKGGSNEKNL